MTKCYYWPQYLPNGGIQWFLVKPWTSSIGQSAWYFTGALPWPLKWPAMWVHFFIVFVFPVALAAAGAIRSE